MNTIGFFLWDYLPTTPDDMRTRIRMVCVPVMTLM